ncbi:MAG: HEAT repeat domain-containing protein [Myxococcota bacterium]|nr:HEAT repeat domain-containing protein [Myxococcota bacterium]
MRDVVLHRSLREGRREPNDLDELAALAALPPARRVGFVAVLAPLLDDPDPTWRAAAVRALTGMRGHTIEEAIVARLDDPHVDVRRAAAKALRHTPGVMRLVHALLHARADVRRAALDDVPPHLGFVAFTLRADPTCVDAVPLGLRAPSLSFVHTYVTRGVLPIEEARLRLFDGIRPLVEARAYPPLREPRTFWDWVFELFAEASDDARVTMLGQLRTFAVGPAPALDDAIAILEGELARRPRDDVARLLAILDARFFADESRPLVQRRQLLAQVRPREALAPAARFRKELAQTLLAGPVVRHHEGPSAGQLDLSAAVAVAELHSDSIYGVLVDAFGFDALADALVRDPRGAARLYERLGGGARDRGWFLDTLAQHRPDVARDGRAVALIGASVMDPKLREALDAEVAREDHVDVFVRLVALAADFVLKAKRATRLAERVVERVREEQLERLLVVATEGDGPLGPFTDRLLGALGRRFEERVVEVVDAAPDTRLAERLAEATTFPFVVERAIAERWRDHPDDARRAWATPRLPKPAPPPPATVGALSEATREAIANASSSADALRTIRGPTTGLTDALRKHAAEPNVSACAALLASHDPRPEVVRELVRFEDASASFRELVITECATRFLMRRDLPLLGHAMLHRWEHHAYATLDALERERARPAAALDEKADEGADEPPIDDPRSSLPRALATWRESRSVLARREVWCACARAFGLLRWHGKERLARLASDALLDRLVETFRSELGVHAARMFVALFEAGVADTLMRTRHAAVMALLPSLDDATRAVLSSFAKLDGLPSRASSKHTFVDASETLRELRGSRDVAHLASLVAAGAPPFAEEAVQRLFELGAPGEDALLGLLDAGGEGAIAVARFGSLFSHVTRSTLLARLPRWPAAARFHLALELAEPALALAAANAPLEGSSCLEAVDVDRLIARVGLHDIALALVSSPHPAAYELAVRACLDGAASITDEEAHHALVRFLEEGTERMAPLRLEAAFTLSRRGDPIGAPLLVEAALTAADVRAGTEADPRATVIGALGLGAHEATAARIARRDGPRPELRELAALLIQARDAEVRARAADTLADARSSTRNHKLRTLAEIFAWGVRRGRELTGRVVRVRLTTGRNQLGHTRLGSSTIFVGGWPVFDGAAHGRDVVEGLVMHELGHQAWHADAASIELWAKAGREHLQHLYNLVLDEHLERRLRAREARDGDRLKRLASYAFQHSGRELPIATLVYALGPDVARVLAGRLLVAFEPDQVRIESGAILRAACEEGRSFARFVRALRMGLGDRDADPRVREALALFDRHFKDLDTTTLYELTKKLAEIFGDEAALLRCLGTPEEIPGDDPRSLEDREDISDEEVQREVERILAPPSKTAGGSGRAGGALQINVGPEDGFTPIREVIRLPPSPDRQRELAREVARPARRLRDELERLGLARVTVGARLAGTRLDRARLRGLVLRGDPHVMQTRVLLPRADLFLGVAVDCSGSMTGTSIELARRFAVLLAESARGLRGVDLRVFGFTDRQLYDAGDAERSTAASLHPGGGNNDAAALAHVAEVARRSGRRAKLLVMISDGLPTECSVEALRKLVRRLGREGMACAQIAVRPLEERCFDDYVEVRDLPTDEAVRRFGAIVARLVQRTIGPS